MPTQNAGGTIRLAGFDANGHEGIRGTIEDGEAILTWHQPIGDTEGLPEDCAVISFEPIIGKNGEYAQRSTNMRESLGHLRGDVRVPILLNGSSRRYVFFDLVVS